MRQPAQTAWLVTASCQFWLRPQAAAGAIAERFLGQLTDAQPSVRSLATTGVLALLVGGRGAAWSRVRPHGAASGVGCTRVMWQVQEGFLES